MRIGEIIAGIILFPIIVVIGLVCGTIEIYRSIHEMLIDEEDYYSY